MKARKKEERNGRLKRIKETDRKKGFEDKRKEKKWHRDRKETDKRKKKGREKRRQEEIYEEGGKSERDRNCLLLKRRKVL